MAVTRERADFGWNKKVVTTTGNDGCCSDAKILACKRAVSQTRLTLSLRCAMRKYWATAAMLSLSIAVPARSFAQDAQQAGAAAASVQAAVGTAVVERALTGEGTTFKAAETPKLYCFSRVENAADSDIEHVWYHGDAEVGRIKLHIGGSPWRTHSTKTLGEGAAGAWRCDVVKDGTVLQSVKFQVE